MPSSPQPPPPAPGHVLFVTGRLAEPALRRTLSEMRPPFAYDVEVLRITVAALMTVPWVAKFLRRVPPGVDLVLLPGLCEGDERELEAALGVPVRKGPKDLREIPEYFGREALRRDYGAHDIEIIAEVNNAPRLTREALLAEATHYHESGADVIDVGCTPGLPFPALGDVVRELRARGMRVSVDSFDPAEIRTAVDAGAELVLSVNGSNLDVARDFAGAGARAVVIPDFGAGLETMDPTVEALTAWGVGFLLDPVVEPIGFGFVASIERFAETRRRYPDAGLLMGVGNITELTAADTTGVNAVLIGMCQELGVSAVLTTEVIPWARGSVREIDVARRLMHYAVRNRVLPKKVDDRLVTVKDPKVLEYPEAELRALQASITDPNFRIFTDREAITVLNRDLFVRGTDIQEIYARLGVDEPTHAFYLGKELAKAKLALTLGKTYRQEGSLNWGYLTPPDDVKSEHVRLTQRSERVKRRKAGSEGSEGGGERQPRQEPMAPPAASPTAGGPPPELDIAPDRENRVTDPLRRGPNPRASAPHSATPGGPPPEINMAPPVGSATTERLPDGPDRSGDDSAASAGPDAPPGTPPGASPA